MVSSSTLTIYEKCSGTLVRTDEVDKIIKRGGQGANMLPNGGMVSGVGDSLWYPCKWRARQEADNGRRLSNNIYVGNNILS